MKEVEQKEKVLLYSNYFLFTFYLLKSKFALAQSVGVTDVELEINLILARASVFTAPGILRMTICPPHRSSLGIGWQRGSYRCRVPEILSSHAHGKLCKADRGIKDHS